MDEGKQQALFEFSYLAAKEGGYDKERVKEFYNLSKEYFIPMISALVNEKLVSSENEFDEAMFVLQQYSPQVVKSKMNVEEAKNGNVVEIIKFFAALTYEFRVRCPTVFTRLCKSMSGESQHNIAHFISYMDNATTDEESDWYNILFTPYSSDDLKRLGAVKTENSIKTPCKTPKRSLLNNSILDNPVDIVINSPTAKDRLIKEYERRLKSEREVARTLQAHCEETFEENAKLKVEVDSLKRKLRRSSTTFISACGEECQSKNELASMKVMMTVRENRVYQLTEELEIVQEELEHTNEILDNNQLEIRQLTERNENLSNEIERLYNVSNELHQTRQKLNAVTKDKDELWIKGSLNADLSARTQRLSTENDQLRKQNEELAERLASMEKLIDELRTASNDKDKSIGELSEKLNSLGMADKLESMEKLTNELRTVLSSKDKMISELTDKLNSTEEQALEIKRLQQILASNKRQVDELKHVKRMRSGRSKMKPVVKRSGKSNVSLKSTVKSSVSSGQTVSEPTTGNNNLDLTHGPALKPEARKSHLGRKIVHIFKKVSCTG